MKRRVLEALIGKVDEVKARYAQPRARAGGVAERWTVHRVQPLSDATAVVIYEKGNSQQQVLMWFFYVDRTGGAFWNYFIPTYDHFHGMQHAALPAMMLDVERHNTEMKLWERENAALSSTRLAVTG